MVNNLLWVTSVFPCDPLEGVTVCPHPLIRLPDLSHHSNLGVELTSLIQLSGKLYYGSAFS